MNRGEESTPFLSGEARPEVACVYSQRHANSQTTQPLVKRQMAAQGPYVAARAWTSKVASDAKVGAGTPIAPRLQAGHFAPLPRRRSWR
ncbi:hypothetical protein MRX96_047244 [Rhipicephalus microplus]